METPDFEVLDEFEVEAEPLGDGAFGSVHRTTKKGTSKLGAVKAISKALTKTAVEADNKKEDWYQLLQLEVTILKDLSATKHRNLPKFFGNYEVCRRPSLVCCFGSCCCASAVTSPGACG